MVGRIGAAEHIGRGPLEGYVLVIESLYGTVRKCWTCRGWCHAPRETPVRGVPGLLELGPLRCCCRGVLAPVVAAVIAPVAAYPDQQRGGPVTERRMPHRPCDRAARSRACSADHAPRVRIGQAAFEHSTLR